MKKNSFQAAIYRLVKINPLLVACSSANEALIYAASRLNLDEANRGDLMRLQGKGSRLADVYRLAIAGTLDKEVWSADVWAAVGAGLMRDAFGQEGKA